MTDKVDSAIYIYDVEFNKIKTIPNIKSAIIYLPLILV